MSTRSFSNGFANANSKSLVEQIAEVRGSNLSRTDKARALIKLGLMQKEAEDMLSVRVARVPREPRQRFTFTFGVEIECITNCMGVQRDLGSSLISIESYNHTDHRDNVFKFVTDGSLIDNNSRARHSINSLLTDEAGTAECVSPVLSSTNGMTALKKVVDTINANDGYVNSSCGLHVHIGAGRLTGEQYVNVFKNYQKLENVIDSFMAPSRRGNCRWARSLQGYDFTYCHNQNDVYSVIGTRYCKVNPVAFEAHGTIEFRQHQGTLNFKKMQMWVRFLGKLVQYSLNNVLAENVFSIDEIPFLNKAEKEWFKARQSGFQTRG